MRKKEKKVYGVGVNDATYPVSRNELIDGKRVQVWVCPFYRRWKDLIQRCYSSKFQKKQPRYKGCVVCEEWKIFSNFKKWMERQDWHGNELDKDLIVHQNKVYSPETCAFVPSDLNRFITERSVLRGGFPIGVHWCERDEAYVAQINNPFTRKRQFIGYFDCPEEAHEAWREKKHEFACMYADMSFDHRVESALRSMYAGKRHIEEWRTEQANQRSERGRYGA